MADELREGNEDEKMETERRRRANEKSRLPGGNFVIPRVYTHVNVYYLNFKVSFRNINLNI